MGRMRGHRGAGRQGPVACAVTKTGTAAASSSRILPAQTQATRASHLNIPRAHRLLTVRDWLLEELKQNRLKPRLGLSLPCNHVKCIFQRNHQAKHKSVKLPGASQCGQKVQDSRPYTAPINAPRRPSHRIPPSFGAFKLTGGKLMKVQGAIFGACKRSRVEGLTRCIYRDMGSGGIKHSSCH